MKKLISGSNIVTCIALILTVVSLIMYGINISAEGFYQGHSVANVVLFGILVIVFCVLIIAAGFLKLNGFAEKLVDICVMVLKVLVPVFLFMIVLALAGDRIEGLGYIYFSNVDVQKEVATPANLASASLAITNISSYALAAVAGIVGSFFLLKKEAAK